MPAKGILSNATEPTAIVGDEANEPILVYTQNNAPFKRGKGFGRFSPLFEGFLLQNLHDSDVLKGTRFDHAYERYNRFKLKAIASSVLPKERVSKCRKWVLPGAQPLIKKSQKGEAHFANLEICSSVWVCPCCAAKISEVRRKELVKAVESAKGEGFSVYLLTLTAPHYRTDDLRDFLKAITAAQTKFWRDKAGKNFIADYLVFGRIRAFEVTHGNNGFHPHFHILLFTEKPIFNVLEAQSRLFDIWAHCCEKKGLKSPNRAHGVKLQDGSKASKYAAKWGLEHEMTKGHIKKSKGSSMFDLLRRLENNFDDTEAVRLFKIFAAAFKGQRQLVWTKGLKERFGIKELNDAEAAKEDFPEAELYWMLSLDEWKRVLKLHAESLLLTLAEKKDVVVFKRFLELIMKEDFKYEKV